MADSQRVSALKKAYAEIILNTAKESASRVLASEKKALRFQRELSTAKDESLRLLVRLKRIVDAKAIEAEITSSSQQSRIDELEAQLQEAEGVIVDLRAELNWVRDKVEKVRKNQCKPLNGKITKDGDLIYQNSASESIIPCPSISQLQTASGSDMKITLLDQKISHEKCCNEKDPNGHLSLSYLENCCSSNADIASSTLTNEELGIYRTGFTQKECALEGNLPAENLAPAEVVDAHSFMYDVIDNAYHTIEEKCSVSSLNIRNMDRMKKLLGASRISVKANALKRKRNWFARARTSYTSCLSQLTKPFQRPSILSRCRTNSENDCLLSTVFNIETKQIGIKKTSGFEEELPCQNGCFTDENKTVQAGKGQRKMENKDMVCNPFEPHDDQQSKVCHSYSLLNYCTSSSLSIYGNVKSGEAQSKVSESGFKLKPLRPGVTVIKGGGLPLSVSTNVTKCVKTPNRSGIASKIANTEAELVCWLVEQEQNTSLHLAAPHYQSNNGNDNLSILLEDGKESRSTTVNVPSEVSDSTVGGTFSEPHQYPDEVLSNRLLKYTFQRKRKKEPLTALDQNSCPEKTTIERSSGEAWWLI